MKLQFFSNFRAVPDRKLARSFILHHLSLFIGHEGKGSLLSELKNLGYVNNLVAGLSSGSKGFDFFIVNVDLTEKGLEHIDDIIKLVFQYFNMLRVQGAQEWVRKFHRIIFLLFWKRKIMNVNYIFTHL